MITEKTTINIKGTREGLLVTLGDAPHEAVFALLETELMTKQQFLRGSRITLAVGQRPFQRDDLKQIQQLFERHDLVLWTVLADNAFTRQAARQLGLATRLPGSQTDLDGNALPPTAKTDANGQPSALPTAEATLLHETVRSGRSIYADGHVVVIGDVNPGAEIIAGGNIVVWGRLRGMVHAGAMGDKTAVICALALRPTQLRIADQIAIAPSDNGRRYQPEQAAIQDGQIVAEAWQVK